MEPVMLYDTTLRDGTQGENISFSAEDKLKIALRLDDFGIHYIEGGWPGSNPRDKKFFELAKTCQLKKAKITAFGSTRRPNIRADQDQNLNALLESGTPAVAIFGKTWVLHVEQIMGNTLEENLAMITDSVAYLKQHDREVIYDAEHFFDGYKENRKYAVKTLLAAIEAGAEYVVLCDTNGGTTHLEISAIIPEVKKELSNALDAKNSPLPVRIGIHAHNDCGLAVANSITAVEQGAVMVHGTMNGYGERCGNADLTTIIPLLAIKMKYPCISDENLCKLKRVSRFISETANMIPQNTRPFVGKSAFAHKGGVHVSAIRKNPRAYEHIPPEMVGNKRRVLVSDLSGRSNIEYKAKELGIDLEQTDFDSDQIVSEIKRLEEQGYQFEAADGSLKILMKKFMNNFMPSFNMESFRVYIEKEKDKPCSSHATIKISVDNNEKITVAEGNGPVSALDNALRKALDKFYPGFLNSTHLVDFKVRVIDGREGTAAKVRVIIDSRDEDHIWSTIGVSEDIIEASWQALQDSLEYKFSKVVDTPENGDKSNQC